MTFDAYWKILAENCEALKDRGAKITMSVESFKADIRMSFAAGEEHGSSKTATLFDKMFPNR